MALTGQALPFDFPLPPRKLVYSPPPPSRSSLEVGGEIHHEITLKDLEDALNRAFPHEDCASPQLQGATGRRRAKSSHVLGSPPLQSVKHAHPTQAQRRTTDGSFRPSPGEGLRAPRKPLAALEFPDFVHYSARRVTGLRPNPAPKHPRRDASLPAAKQLPITKTPSSPPSPRSQKPVQRIAATPGAMSFLARRYHGPRAPLLEPVELTVRRPSTSPTTADSTDSDATYIDSPLSSAFTSPKATLFRNSFTFESLALDLPHGTNAANSNIAIDLGWDWSFASAGSSSSTGSDKPTSNSRAPHSRPTSPKTAHPLYPRFRRSREKAARLEIPQAFRDADAYQGDEDGNEDGDSLPMMPTFAPLAGSRVGDFPGAFPAGEASVVVQDMSRSGWYSSDDEEDDFGPRRRGGGGGNGTGTATGNGHRKFSLSWGKGSLKKGFMRGAGFFRTGSTTSA